MAGIIDRAQGVGPGIKPVRPIDTTEDPPKGPLPYPKTAPAGTDTAPPLTGAPGDGNSHSSVNQFARGATGAPPAGFVNNTLATGATATPPADQHNSLATGATSGPPPEVQNNTLPGGATAPTGDSSTTGTLPGGGAMLNDTPPPSDSTPPPDNPNPGAQSTANSNPGDPTWSPTSGIIDQIQGITPKTIEGQGYTAATIADTPEAKAEGYDATGYTAQQGTAETSNENVSQAVDRITSANSPLLQRAEAQASDQANSRGLLNSTMAVEAGQSAVLDKAITIAQGDIQNAQFNAAEKNAMTISNVHEANAAAAFHAQATNDAAAFSAAAKNSASQFNSAQAQQKALAAAQLWDQAAQFSAAAKQAAEQFNAQSYNDSMQRYVDAKNAAIAAQNDAENLSRRDAAQISAGLDQARIGAAATVGAASQHAAATVAAAQIGASASQANVQAELENQRYMQTQSLNQDMTKFNASMTQQQQQWAASLSATQFDTFQSGLTGIMTGSLEPDAKQNAIGNYLAMWAASGTLPVGIKLPGS